MGDVIGTRGTGRGDAFPDQRARGFESTRALDLREQRPRLLRKGFRQVLDEPRAAAGIEHPSHMRLLDEQQLRVACDTGRERRRHRTQTARNRVVELPNPNAVRATNSGAEGSQGGT